MFLEEEMHQRHGTIHSSVGSGEQRSNPTRCSWDSQPCCLASWEDCNALRRRKRGIVSQVDCVCVCVRLAHAMCLSSPISVPSFPWNFFIKHTSSPFLKAYTAAFLFACKCVCMYCFCGGGHPLRGHCVNMGSIVSICALSLHSSGYFRGNYLTNRSTADLIAVSLG